MAQEDTLVSAALDARVVDRYWAKVVRIEDFECWVWIGAVAGRGHGRFWLGSRKVVIAHRFGWAVTHPDEAMPEVVGHGCDNPICQRPLHWRASTHARNRAEWAARRHRVAGALRDVRGARARAVELRDAAKAGADLTSVSRAGLSPLDRDQSPLW